MNALWACGCGCSLYWLPSVWCLGGHLRHFFLCCTFCTHFSPLSRFVPVLWLWHLGGRAGCRTPWRLRDSPFNPNRAVTPILWVCDHHHLPYKGMSLCSWEQSCNRAWSGGYWGAVGRHRQSPHLCQPRDELPKQGMAGDLLVGCAGTSRELCLRGGRGAGAAMGQIHPHVCAWHK